MKTNFYKTPLFILLIIGMLFIYYRVSNLEYKYETLKEANVRLKSNYPLNETQIKERQFKEEMYIKQQEKDTTLILSIFSLGSLIVGFFTFRSVKEEFVNQINKIKKEHYDYKTEIEKKHSEMIQNNKILRKDLNFESAISLNDKLELISDQKMQIIFKLIIAEKLINVLKDSEDENKTFQDSIISLIDNVIESIVLIFSDETLAENHITLNCEKIIFDKRCRIIMNYLNSNSKDELYRMFLLCISKIKLKKISVLF